MNRGIIAGAVIGALFAKTAIAQPLSPERINALNNLQEEFTTCTLFYQSIIACSPPAKKQEATQIFDPTVRLFRTAQRDAVATNRSVVSSRY